MCNPMWHNTKKQSRTNHLSQEGKTLNPSNFFSEISQEARPNVLYMNHVGIYTSLYIFALTQDYD